MWSRGLTATYFDEGTRRPLSPCLLSSALFPAPEFCRVSGQLTRSSCFGITWRYQIGLRTWPLEMVSESVGGRPLTSRKGFNAGSSLS